MHEAVCIYKKLIKDCIKGQIKAQEELYNLFAPRMLSLCYRYAKNKVDAEDIFQSGWLKVFEHLKQLRKAELLEWWMKKIFINEALQYYNKAKKIVYMEEYHIHEQENIAYKKIIHGFFHDQITLLIQELPDKMRMVFNLYIIEGFSHKEIAVMMNITEGTSKSNLHDARKILKRKIALLDPEIKIKTHRL